MPSKGCDRLRTGDLAVFLGVSTLVIVTPGQDTVLTVRNTLIGGRGTGFSTAVGVCAGQATWALATSTGIGAVVAASETAFLALKVLGSAYLLFLGARTIVRATRWRAMAPPRDDGSGGHLRAHGTASRPDQQPCESQDSGLLHGTVASVRRFLRRATCPRSSVLLDDARLAERVHGCSREGEGFAPATTFRTCDRGVHRRGADRARGTARRQRRLDARARGSLMRVSYPRGRVRFRRSDGGAVG